jgi:drug/metabolite transporter (DMT)-like permease
MRTGVACAVAVVCIWALFIVLSRRDVRGEVTIYDLAFLRFGFAALLVAPIALARPPGRRLGGLTPMRALALTLFGGLGFTVFAFLGLTMAPAAHGAVLMPGTLPFFAALIARALLGERITPRKAMGLAAILAGVVLMGVEAFSGTQFGTWKGDLMFPLAACCWAMFTVLSRKWRVDALDATVAIPLFALILFLPAYLAFAPKQLALVPWSVWLPLAFFQGGIALVASMWAFSKVVAAFGPTRTTMITALAPALAALIAVPLLGELLSFPVTLGLLCVTAGMIIGVGGAPVPVQPGVK